MINAIYIFLSQVFKKILGRASPSPSLFLFFFNVGIIDFIRISLSSYCYALFVYSKSRNPSRDDTTFSQIHSTCAKVINVMILRLINFLSHYFSCNAQCLGSRFRYMFRYIVYYQSCAGSPVNWAVSKDRLRD